MGALSFLLPTTLMKSTTMSSLRVFSLNHSSQVGQSITPLISSRMGYFTSLAGLASDLQMLLICVHIEAYSFESLFKLLSHVVACYVHYVSHLSLLLHN